MCTGPSTIISGWKGWLPIPATKEQTGNHGPWIDLSCIITEDLSRSPAFPKPSIQRIAAIPNSPANITDLHMVCHHGTHVDAPRHFFNDAPAFHEIPLERLYGPGVVWKLNVPPFGLIYADDFERARPIAQEGDIIVIDTGWWRKCNTPDYETHPSLDKSAAMWLVDHKIKLIGVDFSTPDLVAHLRPVDFEFPVHHILLSQGVLVAEHMTNLESLSNQRVEFFFGAINIFDSDGGPSRVLARSVN